MANPDGRPPKIEFTPKVLQRVRKLAAQGMFEKDIALCLGYTPGHFSALKRENSLLSAALKEGAAEGIEAATDSLMAEVKRRNMTATIFYLKAKAGWRDNAAYGADAGSGDGDSGSDTVRIRDDVQRVRGSRGSHSSEDSAD